MPGGRGRQAVEDPVEADQDVPRRQRRRHPSTASWCRSVAGAITPAIDRTCPLAQAAAAVRHLAEGPARGKVVVSL